MKRRLALGLLLIWVLPALACNLPTAPRGSVDIGVAAEQTLAAIQVATALAEPPAATPAAPLPQITTDLGIVTVTPPPGAPAPPAAGGLPVPQPAGSQLNYTTQPGDTLAGLSGRFDLPAEDLLALGQNLMTGGLLPSGIQLSIPNADGELLLTGSLLPDAEIVYSPASVDFPVEEFVRQAGGYLSTYTERVDQETLTGAQIIQRVASETSTNPRLLLAFLEYRSGWVLGSPNANTQTAYPIGFYADQYSGLHKEMTLVARQLTIGYYGWRSGKVTSLEFVDNSRRRIDPTINAGTAALQYLFAKLYKPDAWMAELYTPGSFVTFYREKFGDPWQRHAALGPLLPDGLAQPPVELPFAQGESWSFTGGPHLSWGTGGPNGALDFAPAAVERGCGVSRFWTTAVAPGLVVRSERGAVALDLDGDGYEQTGWVFFYFHVAQQDRVAAGTYLNANDPVGHPSCEGGRATGTHVHIARKYNGEWIPADGFVPFTLSGWQVIAGERAYSGSLVNGDSIVTARPDGAHTSIITR
ncbi:MAG: LysM peptidoglycan-binding domain-containing M23 family metallopeptidase [Chloroflexi bacterium]|nr:LysM peptidoglycan-binding domain-containing M23 family metallopeptidase [Chloroflexota bacterium]